ncbi:hypothetical protein Mapa_002865 [Marchantia paleacea]|nr:hypothetical protein Mapa_002865 [Marchantia paleacea]
MTETDRARASSEKRREEKSKGKETATAKTMALSIRRKYENYRLSRNEGAVMGFTSRYKPLFIQATKPYATGRALRSCAVHTFFARGRTAVVVPQNHPYHPPWKSIVQAKPCQAKL